MYACIRILWLEFVGCVLKILSQGHALIIQLQAEFHTKFFSIKLVVLKYTI